jgi:hypothetical protein
MRQRVFAYRHDPPPHFSRGRPRGKIGSPVNPPGPTDTRVSTAGAWLGVGIAVRAAAGALAHFAPLVLVAGIPLFVDVLDRSARAQEVPPEFMRVADLWLELTTVVGPYARAIGGSGVLVGLLLFVAAGFLMRGAETGRRIVRVLLVAHVAHSIAATVWGVSIALGPGAEWARRYAKAFTELREALPGIEERFPAAIDGSIAPTLAIMLAGVGALGLVLDALLFWLAGGPSARGWCTARRGVASTPGPR